MTVVVITPPNDLFRIVSVWVYVSVDKDGNEGVCAATLPGLGLTPLIAADEARLRSLTPIARNIAKSTGMTIRLIKLSMREEVSVIEP